MYNIEDDIDVLVDTIDGLTPLTAWRSNTDRLNALTEDTDGGSFIIVSLMDTGKKEVLSLNNFVGKRDNPLYNNYGYLNIYRGFVRVVTTSRRQSRDYANTIESYLKVKFNSISEHIVIRRHSFSAQKVFTILAETTLYGVEIAFDVAFLNVWDDEPEQGAESQVTVDEIIIDDINQKDIKIRVSYG